MGGRLNGRLSGRLSGRLRLSGCLSGHHSGSAVKPFAMTLEYLPPLLSEKFERAGTVDFKKHPAEKVGTRSQQCGPKVPGRFAFPGARTPRNPRICSIWRFGKIFPAIFPGLSQSFFENPRTDPGNSHSLSSFLIN